MTFLDCRRMEPGVGGATCVKHTRYARWLRLAAGERVFANSRYIYVCSLVCARSLCVHIARVYPLLRRYLFSARTYIRLYNHIVSSYIQSPRAYEFSLFDARALPRNTAEYTSSYMRAACVRIRAVFFLSLLLRSPIPPM